MDEHALYSVFKDDFKGYEEPNDVVQILNYSKPYLHYEGALGEMVLSCGKAIYYYKKGCAGIIDVSPFTCMNGIITQAIFPRVSKDHDNIPIKSIFFDGTKRDFDKDLEMFLELSKQYINRRKMNRG